MSTHTLFFVVAVGIVVLFAGALIAVVLASGAKSQEKRMRDLHARHLANQPWDAHSAEGRGNR